MVHCSRDAESLPISHLLRQDTASILHTVPTLSSNPGGSESILENRHALIAHELELISDMSPEKRPCVHHPLIEFAQNNALAPVAHSTVTPADACEAYTLAHANVRGGDAAMNRRKLVGLMGLSAANFALAQPVCAVA
jgi:hypothetical protein